MSCSDFLYSTHLEWLSLLIIDTSQLVLLAIPGVTLWVVSRFFDDGRTRATK